MDRLPAHKVIPGTTFTVDGFRSVSPAVTAYFLSHAHSGEAVQQPCASRAMLPSDQQELVRWAVGAPDRAVACTHSRRNMEHSGTLGSG
jgi:hypothetical protein